jgi:hypothetical protein
MITIPFIAVGSSLILAGLTPAKVNDVETNSSAAPTLKRPSVIYIRSFNISNTVAVSEDTAASRRPHLLGALRGGAQNTIIGRRREQRREDTLAKVPGVLQEALIEDLSKSVAPAANGDDARTSPDCWVVSGEFVEVDTGNRVLQAGVGFGAGQSQLEVQARVYADADMNTPFLSFDSKGASGHLPGAVLTKNPYVAAAKFVMSRREPEREAKKVAKAIAGEIGKFMAVQGIPTLKSMKATNGASPVVR